MEKKKLVEIKAGEEGTGLLIENDGYISMNEGKNKALYESIIKEDVDGDSPKCPYPFIVSAVFQKYGIENANGRIYPESILKREVEKYQEKIKKKKAIGECYTPDVMVLCENGWKEIKDVKEGENILTLNTETGEIEVQAVTKKIEYHHKGKMVNIEGRNISETVTENHGYPVYNRYGKFSGFYTADDILKDNVKDMAHSFIPKTANWTCEGDEYITIPAIDNPSKNTLRLHPDCVNDLVIPTSTFMKFLGIYLSEGDYRKDNNDVNIYQVKETVCDMIQDLMIEMSLPYTININKAGRHTFRINDPRLNKYVSQFGDCYTKFIPENIKKQSKENLRILYDWFVLGDGRIRGDKRRKNASLSDDIFSVSKKLVLDLNEIQLKIGYSGNYHMENRRFDREIQGRLIEGVNCSNMHFSLRSLTKGIYLDKRFINVKEVDYDGDVMCVEVPNHTFYVMSNGKCHWSKNCNHPSESVIDLSRVAMNIIELHWEGATLVGQLEVLISEGFRKYGIISCCGDEVANLLLKNIEIGVSSRGLGSVTQRMGKLIVGEDFELVCWDFVSDNSTPGALVKFHREELEPYIESKETNKSPIIEKLERFNDWLVD